MADAGRFLPWKPPREVTASVSLKNSPALDSITSTETLHNLDITFLFSCVRDKLFLVFVFQCLFLQVRQKSLSVERSRGLFGSLVLLSETRRQKGVLQDKQRELRPSNEITHKKQQLVKLLKLLLTDFGGIDSRIVLVYRTKKQKSFPFLFTGQ